MEREDYIEEGMNELWGYEGVLRVKGKLWGKIMRGEMSTYEVRQWRKGYRGRKSAFLKEIMRCRLWEKPRRGNNEGDDGRFWAKSYEVKKKIMKGDCKGIVMKGKMILVKDIEEQGMRKNYEEKMRDYKGRLGLWIWEAEKQGNRELWRMRTCKGAGCWGDDMDRRAAGEAREWGKRDWFAAFPQADIPRAQQDYFVRNVPKAAKSCRSLTSFHDFYLYN